MASKTPIGGTAQIRVNGEQIEFRGDLTWNFQVAQKKGIAGRDGRVHGFVTDPVVPYIEMEVTVSGRKTTKDLEAIVDATVQAVLADGRQLVLRGAYVAGEITPGLDEAKMKLKFEGTDGEEIPAPGA